MKKLTYLLLGLLIGFFACKYLFNQSLTNDTMEIIKPKGVITPEQAKQLDQNYNQRHALISKDLGLDDNRSSWYSIEDLENYLVYAKNQADTLGYKLDGIRIYEGAHGERGLTTMFLVPTGIPSENPNVKNLVARATAGDIPGGDALNDGNDGNPPSANYPQ